MSKDSIDMFVKQELAKRQTNFTSEHIFTVFVITWNVNGKKPPENLEDLFTAKNASLDTKFMDIKTFDDIPDLWVFNF